jgi:hypothetical protein
MANPPELWTFTIANFVTFGLGSILTALSFYAYRTNGRRRSLRDATVGFGFLTLGMVVEPVYQLGFRGDFRLNGRELLALQTIEGVLLSLGLGLLFYSIYVHGRGERTIHARVGDRATKSGDEPRL